MTAVNNNTNSFTKSARDTISRGLQVTKEFLAETPPEALVSLITSIVLQIFKTKLALPSYGILIGCTLSKFTLIILSKIRPETANVIIDKTNQFHEKFAFIPVILWVAATILAWFVPVAGFAIGIAIGVYYGPVAEKNRHLVQQATPPNTNENYTLGL